MTREETIVNLEKLIALFHTASEQSKKDGLFRNTVKGGESEHHQKRYR